MTTDARAREVVEGMLARDKYSAWLGLELVSVEAGACTCRLTVRGGIDDDGIATIVRGKHAQQLVSLNVTASELSSEACGSTCGRASFATAATTSSSRSGAIFSWGAFIRGAECRL